MLEITGTTQSADQFLLDSEPVGSFGSGDLSAKLLAQASMSPNRNTLPPTRTIPQRDECCFVLGYN
jgi:hypothetical protein